MGITIHYSGKCENHARVTKVMDVAQMFSAKRGWMFAMFDDPMGEFDDRDPDDVGYTEHDGPVRGIVIRIHHKCEAVRLTFDVRHRLEASTKTAYAPFAVHVEIIKLLREIEPLFEEFKVIDEAELWETDDLTAAKSRFGSDDSRQGYDDPPPAEPDDPDDLFGPPPNWCGPQDSPREDEYEELPPEQRPWG